MTPHLQRGQRRQAAREGRAEALPPGGVVAPRRLALAARGLGGGGGDGVRLGAGGAGGVGAGARHAADGGDQAQRAAGRRACAR
jgi:hypothetical protein